MKFKTTAKAIKNSGRVFSIGYCNFDNVLKLKSPIAYTCGVYGWNSNVYEIAPGLFISAGYRPFKNIVCPFTDEEIKAIDEKAAAIFGGSKSWNTKEQEYYRLYDAFVAEAVARVNSVK